MVSIYSFAKQLVPSIRPSSSRRVVKLFMTGSFAISAIFITDAISVVAQQADSAVAQEMQGYSATQWKDTVDGSIEFLRTAGQSEDGSFSGQNGIGVTAIVTAGLLRVGLDPSDTMVAKALDFLLKHQRDDGGIYAERSSHKNYETCLTIMALIEANKDGKYSEQLAKAEAFIKQIQWDETEEVKPENMNYGGAGYGSHERPDLSNTSFLIEALKSLGRDESDPAMQRALTFVTRCQNFESSANSAPFAGKINDGGFFYTAAAGGESKAGTEANGGLRSYGSMTYAGLKSMIFAGVDDNDPRVIAAQNYLKDHYTLASNPGVGTNGLFYYYHTMAKALNALDVDEFEAADGIHNWRNELFDRLNKLQQENGAWVNSDPRWLEGDPNLVSGYVLLSLSYLEP